MAKRTYTRHETEEKRHLEFETIQTQRILRETAQLSLQVLQRASFQATPDHIQILQQVAEDDGRENAAELLTNDSRKAKANELQRLGYLQWYGDAGLLLEGFEITDEGRNLITSSQTHPDDNLASAGQDTEPTGERLLQASDPEAKAFRDAKQWCTAAYAQQRYGIKAQQLTRASKQENGLGGIIVNRSRAQVDKGKRGQVWVYHAGDLQRLANRLDHEE